MLEKYKTVHQFAQKEIVVKRSRFIASVLPTDNEAVVQEFIENLRKEHWEAVHNVFAYQLGFKNEIQRQSDDGEPQGTAGKPVLEVIKRGELKNTVVVVTRYFGGILLGAGGLIRAYGQSAKEGILEAGIVWKILHQELFLEIEYTWLGKIQNLLMNEGCIIEDTQYTDKVTLKVLIPLSNLGKIKKLLIESTGDQVSIGEGNRRYLTEKKGQTILGQGDEYGNH